MARKSSPDVNKLSLLLIAIVFALISGFLRFAYRGGWEVHVRIRRVRVCICCSGMCDYEADGASRRAVKWRRGRKGNWDDTRGIAGDPTTVIPSRHKQTQMFPLNAWWRLHLSEPVAFFGPVIITSEGVGSVVPHSASNQDWLGVW